MLPATDSTTHSTHVSQMKQASTADLTCASHRLLGPPPQTPCPTKTVRCCRGEVSALLSRSALLLKCTSTRCPTQADSQPHLAMTNSSRTMREPSPMYFCTSSLPLTRMNVQSVWWATARASSVLPVPGGPYNNTPCKQSEAHHGINGRMVCKAVSARLPACQDCNA